MSDLLQLQEPAEPARRAPPSWAAFLELGFRPLYLMGGAWAIVAAALWVLAPGWLQGPLQGVAWHAHEMLWGFVVTIAVGFLLTAGANWTGHNPLQGRPLAALCGLWLLARAGLLWPGTALYPLAVAADVGFLLAAALAMARVVWRARNRRNYVVPALLVGLALADALFLHAAARGDTATLMRHFESGLLAMAVVALLVGRRVIPFFAMRAVPGLKIDMHEGSARVQLVLGGAAVLLSLAQGLAAGADGAAAGVWAALGPLRAALLAVTGALSLWQLAAWRPRAVAGRPMLWILYLGYAGLAVGLLLAAARTAGMPWRAALPVHVVGMAGFAVLIIGMLHRTALGHLGRALALDRWMLVSHHLLLCAVALRLAALWPSPWTPALWQAATAAWTLAFGLYLARFWGWMVRPRPDVRGTPVKVGGQAVGIQVQPLRRPGAPS